MIHVHSSQTNFMQIGLATSDEIQNWSKRSYEMVRPDVLGRTASADLLGSELIEIGEVKKADTINYRTFKPEKDGLFCERIFGPVNDWVCSCGQWSGMGPAKIRENPVKPPEKELPGTKSGQISAMRSMTNVDGMTKAKLGGVLSPFPLDHRRAGGGSIWFYSLPQDVGSFLQGPPQKALAQGQPNTIQGAQRQKIPNQNLSRLPSAIAARLVGLKVPPAKPWAAQKEGREKNPRGFDDCITDANELRWGTPLVQQDSTGTRTPGFGGTSSSASKQFVGVPGHPTNPEGSEDRTKKNGGKPFSWPGGKNTSSACQICPNCHVEITLARIRRYRMGYIALACPVTHVWFLNSRPNIFSVLMKMPTKYVKKINYYKGYSLSQSRFFTPCLGPGGDFFDTEWEFLHQWFGSESSNMGFSSDRPSGKRTVRQVPSNSPDRFSETATLGGSRWLNLGNTPMSSWTKGVLRSVESGKSNARRRSVGSFLLAGSGTGSVKKSSIFRYGTESSLRRWGGKASFADKKTGSRIFPATPNPGSTGKNQSLSEISLSFQFGRSWTKAGVQAGEGYYEEKKPFPEYPLWLENTGAHAFDNYFQNRNWEKEYKKLQNELRLTPRLIPFESEEHFPLPAFLPPGSIFPEHSGVQFSPGAAGEKLDQGGPKPSFDFDLRISDDVWHHYNTHVQFLVKRRKKRVRKFKLLTILRTAGHFKNQAKRSWHAGSLPSLRRQSDFEPQEQPFIFRNIPVLPPELRPIVQLNAGQLASSDVNDLYRRVISRNNRLKYYLTSCGPHLVEFLVRSEQHLVQLSVDALFENGKTSALLGKDKVTGSRTASPRGQTYKSLSDRIGGKQGRFRQNLLGKRVDYSGRSVIVVGPKLKLNECGLPYEMAVELFQAFLIRHILELQLAKTIRSAKNILKYNQPFTQNLLQNVLQSHPVLLNRAPTLHRLGIQAFQPKLVPGRAIQLHPLVCTAFNADFDGDQMAVHVPLSAKARIEARLLMLATTNWFSPATGQPSILPSQDMVLGFYYLTIENPIVSWRPNAAPNTGARHPSPKNFSSTGSQTQPIKGGEGIWSSAAGQASLPSLASKNPAQSVESRLNTFEPNTFEPPAQPVVQTGKQQTGKGDVLPKGPVDLFDCLQAYEKGILDLHSYVWIFVAVPGVQSERVASLPLSGLFNTTPPPFRKLHPFDDSVFVHGLKRPVRESRRSLKSSFVKRLQNESFESGPLVFFGSSKRKSLFFLPPSLSRGNELKQTTLGKNKSDREPDQLGKVQAAYREASGRPGKNPEEPLFIRIAGSGRSTKVFSSYKWTEDSLENRTNQSLRTTPGRVLVNKILLEFLQKDFRSLD